MSILFKGKERIDVMIINMNSPNLLSFHLLDQALDLDIVPFCVCNKYDASLAKKAFQNGAHLYLEKPLHQEIVKYLWKFVLPKRKIPKEKSREGLEENGDHHKHADNVDSNSFVGGDKEQGNIHETANVASNEKYKLRRKRGRKQINGGKSQRSATKFVARQSRIKWTANLHVEFMKAVNQLDEDRCFPRDILRIMNVPNLTRLQVASHLQKCRNNAWRVSKERISTRHQSSQAGFSSRSTQRSSFKKIGTTSRLKMNATNLQQQQQQPYNQETQRGSEISFLPNNTIFARGESSKKVYHPKLQVESQYINPFNAPSLPLPGNDNVVGLQPQQEPLSELVGSNIGSAYCITGLEFDNGIHHAQIDYALDAATYSTMPDTNTENATINGLGAANMSNMSQPNNIVTISHVSDTQGSESNGRMNCDAYSDFTDMDYLFENYENSSSTPNEHASEFDQIFFDDMEALSVQFPDITRFPDDSST